MKDPTNKRVELIMSYEALKQLMEFRNKPVPPVKVSQPQKKPEYNPG